MKDCHGCGGKGWVELSHGQAVKCPVCGGAGKVNEQEAPNHHQGLGRRGLPVQSGVLVRCVSHSSPRRQHHQGAAVGYRGGAGGHDDRAGGGAGAGACQEGAWSVCRGAGVRRWMLGCW